MENELKELRKYFEQRMDQFEKTLTLLLLSGIMDGLENAGQLELSNKVITVIEKNNFSVVKIEQFGERVAVYINSLQKIGLKEIRIMKGELNEKFHNLVPVFVLDKVNGAQRKKLLEEKISFCIENKEMYVIK